MVRFRLFGVALLVPAMLPAQHQATGFKVGEVSATTAIVWARLTALPQPNAAAAPMVRFDFEPRADGKPSRRVTRVRYPEGQGVAGIRFAAPGAAGEARVRYRPEGATSWSETKWESVDPDRDYTRQFSLASLLPNTRYRVRVDGRAVGADRLTSRLLGRFMTAPGPKDAARVSFVVTTGQAYRDRDGDHGYDVYAAMLELQPSFFVHTGDIVYYDRLAKTVELARYHWQRTYSRPSNVAFHRRVASYFIKDDHDTWTNDCWPTMQNRTMFEFTFAQGQEVFREQVPMGPRTFRRRRWGRDLEVWFVEGRDFRSSNRAPDGPEKTILGARQKAWLEQSLANSDATFRVLVSATPIVGPDRKGKADNHSNAAFAHEGAWLRGMLAKQDDVFVVCGDRHWQYASVDPEAGVREYSCGPASEKHAGGWKKSDFVKSHHRFLNVGGGFLEVVVDRVASQPVIRFLFRDVNGELKFEDSAVATR